MSKKKRRSVGDMIADVITGRDTDLDTTPDAVDEYPWNTFHTPSSELWIQEAVGEEGRVEEYLEDVYGPKAFNANGTIKVSYINRAIKRIKARHADGVPRDSNDYSLMMALILAKRLKKIGRGRR